MFGNKHFKKNSRIKTFKTNVCEFRKVTNSIIRKMQVFLEDVWAMTWLNPMNRMIKLLR